MAAPRNPLQEQLLKAGLAKKSQVGKASREQAGQGGGKTPPAASHDAVDADRLRQEKAERDRALSAERNAQARMLELRAQVRQIVEQHKLAPCIDQDGASAYRFEHDGAIRSVPVSDAVRRQLASGALVIARHDAGYALVPRAAAEKIEARDPSAIVLDHRRPKPAEPEGDDAEYYRRFPVPDDLVW